MLELRCNIAPDETYFYTKHIVKRKERDSRGGKGGRSGALRGVREGMLI
jgi:hypothetical protein